MLKLKNVIVENNEGEVIKINCTGIETELFLGKFVMFTDDYGKKVKGMINAESIFSIRCYYEN